MGAAEFLFGPEGTVDLCQLTDLIDSVERAAHAKAFDEGYDKGHEAGYAEGYADAIEDQNEIDEIIEHTADEVTAERDDYDVSKMGKKSFLDDED